jgi:hypothetical protein
VNSRRLAAMTMKKRDKRHNTVKRRGFKREARKWRKQKIQQEQQHSLPQVLLARPSRLPAQQRVASASRSGGCAVGRRAMRWIVSSSKQLYQGRPDAGSKACDPSCSQSVFVALPPAGRFWGDLMPSSRVGGVVDRVGFGDLDAVAWKFES